jgi:diguanylate cyclase (GGDEF)-like protein/PAS domain S-box-containing protein
LRALAIGAVGVVVLSATAPYDLRAQHRHDHPLGQILAQKTAAQTAVADSRWSMVASPFALDPMPDRARFIATAMDRSGRSTPALHPNDRDIDQSLAGDVGGPSAAVQHRVNRSGADIGIGQDRAMALPPAHVVALMILAIGVVILTVTAARRVIDQRRRMPPAPQPAPPVPRADTERARLDELVGLIPMGILTLDRDGRITDLNAHAEEVFASEERKLVGRDFTTLLAEPLELLQSASVAGPVKINGLDPYGGLIPLELSIGSLGAGQGQVRFVVVNDVSQHQRLESALRQGVDRCRESEQRQRLLIDTVGEGIFGLDRDGRVNFMNPAAARMLGYRLDEVRDRRIGEGPDGLGICQANCPMLARDPNDNLKGETRLKRSDGSVFDVGFSLTPMPEHSGAVVVFGDISSRKRAEASLMLAERVFQHITEGIVVADSTGRILRVNRALCAMVGYDEADLIDQPRPPYQSGEHPPVFYQQMWDTLHKEGHWEGEIWNQRRDGELFPTWQTIVAVTDDEVAVEYVSVIRDITEQRRSEQRIHRLAYFDNLTGLPNRELFFDRFTHAIQRAHRLRSRLALLFLDLDRFKNVNDGLGHPIGDQLLQAVARRLQRLVRGEDTIARLGGDEFTILLESASDRDAIGAVAQKVVEALSQPFTIEDHKLHIGASIGISLYPTHGDDATTLVKHADAAMYQAKAAGRNNYQFFDRSMSSGTRNRMALETRLHRAIHNEEFTLHYQPLFGADGQMVGVEALIRWQDPVMGMIPPGDFIPLAEETGLIVVIGEWALRSACQQMRHWQARGAPSIRLSVNLAGPQIMRGNIVVAVDEVLRDTGIDPQLLELEVTETFVMDHVEQVVSILSGLRDLGVRIAVDDFGTGHSSLATLKRLPVDTLKIDRAFVNDLPDDRNDVAIARAILAMARELSLETIAEGVETEQQRKFLAAEGCDYFQGFLLARPLPPEAVEPIWGHYRQLGIMG